MSTLLVDRMDTAKEILSNIDWSFYRRPGMIARAVRPFNCRSYHWFPATFVPEIPFTLIDVLTQPGAVVYDPFGGIGTTYFQALSLNRRPVMTEVCTVAVEFARSLFELFSPDTQFEKIKMNIASMLEEYDAAKDYTTSVPKRVLTSLLAPWYSPETFNELSFLFAKEASYHDSALKAVNRISISAILASASSQDRGWGCIADNVLPKKNKIKHNDALALFRKRANRLIKDVAQQTKGAMSGYGKVYKELASKETILHEDVRECESIAAGSVDLVVTSPPYPNMTDYVTSQRLSYYFFGIDASNKGQLNDFQDEIGARSRRTRSDSLTKYLDDMQAANETISCKLRKGGIACFVMPVFAEDADNNIQRKHVVSKIIADLRTFDLEKEEEFRRVIPRIRRSHNAKWASLEREKIYLFRKI
jgi:hypothetical protein